MVDGRLVLLFHWIIREVDFAEWINLLPKTDLNVMIFSDEAHFYFTESLNKQNNRLYLKEKPLD